VAVAASYSYAHSVGLGVSLIWWGIYCGALGASIGALPGLFTQRDRARTLSEKNPPRVSGLRPRNSVNKVKTMSRVTGTRTPLRLRRPDRPILPGVCLGMKGRLSRSSQTPVP
jgi:hypothetical protein